MVSRRRGNAKRWGLFALTFGFSVGVVLWRECVREVRGSARIFELQAGDLSSGDSSDTEEPRALSKRA